MLRFKLRFYLLLMDIFAACGRWSRRLNLWAVGKAADYDDALDEVDARKKAGIGIRKD